MADPFLYLEDLVKAEVPKPPASIGGGAKAPKAQKTLGQKATPQPPKNIGTGTIANAPKPPAAQQTIAQGSASPPASPGAKALGGPKVKLEYWSGDGTPPAEGGWTRTESGAWARPEGSGGKGGKGEAESLVGQIAKEGLKDETTRKLKEQEASQKPVEKLISSSGESAKPGPASSSAAKIEEAKQANNIDSQLQGMLRQRGKGPAKPDTQYATADVRTAAHKEVKAAEGEEKDKQAIFGGRKSKAGKEGALSKEEQAQAQKDMGGLDNVKEWLDKEDAKSKVAWHEGPGAGPEQKDTKDLAKEKKENSKALSGHLMDAADHMKKEDWKKVDASMDEAYKLRDKMSPAEQTKLDDAMQQIAARRAKAEANSENKPEKKPNGAVPVTSFEGELARDSHKQSASELSENIRAHLESGEMDDAKRKQLEKIADELDKHGDIEDMPTDVQKKILSLGKKLAGEHGKKPKQPKEEQEANVEKKPPVNYSGKFDRGRAAGQGIGHAAATAEGAGALASDVIGYAASGAVNAGHHLLSGGTDKKAAAAAEKAPKKGAEVEQSSMKTEKSLGLYINLDSDLVKAVNSPNVGSTTPTESRARIKHESSYAKRPVGVANEGIVTEDDPDKGKQWKHDDKDAVETSVNEKLKADEAGEEEEEETTEETAEKALGHNPIEFLKSLNTEVREELSRVLPNDTESLFMIDVLGFDPAVVSKGQAIISGKDRHRFNEWAQARLSKSIASLNERIVTK